MRCFRPLYASDSFGEVLVSAMLVSWIALSTPFHRSNHENRQEFTPTSCKQHEAKGQTDSLEAVSTTKLRGQLYGGRGRGEEEKGRVWVSSHGAGDTTVNTGGEQVP